MQYLGSKVTDDRERMILLAYQKCLDNGSHRFIIEETSRSEELEHAILLLLCDIWDPKRFRIRRFVRSGVFLRFETRRSNELCLTVGQWIGNRRYGEVYVDAIREIRDWVKSKPA
ncbi:MAG: hypothetical protein ACR2PG_18875 [Hyphomicrobiaceae bacterium]